MMDSVAMIHYTNNNNYYYPTYQHQLLTAKDLALSASPTSSVTEIDELFSSNSGKTNYHNHHYSIASAITSTPTSIESSYSPSLSLTDYRSMDEADQIVPDCTTVANNNIKMTNNRHYLYHHSHNHHYSTNPSISPNSVWSMVHEVFKNLIFFNIFLIISKEHDKTKPTYIVGQERVSYNISYLHTYLHTYIHIDIDIDIDIWVYLLNDLLEIMKTIMICFLAN